MNSESDMHLFSSLSFSVYYVYSNLASVTQRSNSSCICIHFLFFFYPPVEVLCCRPKYWANIIHRYNDQNSLTSKCIENWALFERLTHSQRLALSVSPGAPGVCPTQSPRKPALFGPVQGCVYKHLSAPGLTSEKISVSRGEAQPFGKFTPAERPENSL